MTLDTVLRAAADSLISEYGKTVTLRRTIKSIYDPTAGTGGGSLAPTDYTNIKVTPPKDFMFKNLDGTLIEVGDQVVSMAALNAPVEPDSDTDTIIMDGGVWNKFVLCHNFSQCVVRICALVSLLSAACCMHQ